MRVCVVGAGPSGLTTIKQLLDEGHEVVCFERNESVGGIWYRNDKNDHDQMKVYDDLVLTISMKLMSYSDDMIKGPRVFYDRKRYLAYMGEYADKFGLRERIRVSHTVSEIKKTADNRWEVTATSKGESSKHTFDAVAICCGPFHKPYKEVTDLEKFSGEVLHSSQYRNPSKYRGKRVLVVGLAESGADVLRQISDVSSECTLSIRSRAFLLPRLVAGRYSTDASTTRAHHYEMWVRATDVEFPGKALFGDSKPARMFFSGVTQAYGLASVAASKISKALAKRRGGDKAESRPKETVNNLGDPMYPRKLDVSCEWTQEHVDAINEWNRLSHKNEGNWTAKTIFCKNVSFIPNIVNGKVKVNDSGIERIEGHRVTFKNGESREYDAIVLCTGFVREFSVWGKDIAVTDNNVRNLYKHAFHPDHDGTLAYIGFVRPFSGAIPCCSEMQARYFALLCSGKIKLPADVRDRIAKDKHWEEVFTSLSPRHTESIPSQIMFMDSIAKEIGCLMPMAELVFRPRLLIRHWFYPFNQACYRLRGPHAMPREALAEIMQEEPGPLGSSVPMMMFVKLASRAPHVHPKDFEHIGPGPKRPTDRQPPAGSPNVAPTNGSATLT